MRLISFLFVTLLVFSNSAWSQTEKNESKTDKELSECLDKPENQTTAIMCDCAYKALDAWDKRLNIAYQALLLKLNAAAKAKFIDAQREWVQFKEKEIRLIDEVYGHAEGTMWRVVRANGVLDITRDRAVDLEQLLETLKGI